MSLYFHIFRLINRKFYLLQLLLLLNLLAFIPVIFSDWLSLFISTDIKIPLAQAFIKPKIICFAGKDILGFFVFLPLLPLIFLYFEYMRRYAWVVSAIIFFVAILHLINLYYVYEYIQNQSPSFLSFKKDLSLSMFFYLGLSLSQSLISFGIHKTS